MKEEKYIYLTDYKPVLIVFNKNRSNSFQEVLNEFETLNKIDFIKKYSKLLEKNIQRDWVLQFSSVIKRRYNLTSLNSFYDEEKFFYNEFLKVLRWSEDIEIYEDNDKENIDLLLKYVLFFKCNGIEEKTWYMLPEFNYSVNFYRTFLPNTYDYLLSEDFVDESINMSYINLLNSDNDCYELDNANNKFYAFKDSYVKSIIIEMKSNVFKLEKVSDIKEKTILKEDYDEFLNILQRANSDEYLLLVNL